MDATCGLENLYFDNPTPIASAGVFADIKTKLTLHVPEGSVSAYKDLWTGFKDVKPRRKVVFHMNGNNSPTDRVCGTYQDGTGADRTYYWYYTVGEPMETPEMYDGSIYTPVWYTDADCSVPLDLSAPIQASSEDNPQPLDLYAKWSQITYYTVKLHWNDGRPDTEVTEQEGVILAPLFPKAAREGYSFAGWYDNPDCTGAAFDPGVVPTYDTQNNPVIAGVKYLNSNLELYAKWEQKPWMYSPLVVEMDAAGSLPASFAAAFAKRTEFLDKGIGDIYAIVRMEIRGTVNNGTGFSGGYSSWYSKNLRDKVVSLDLREARIPKELSYEGVWSYYSSLLQEVHMPVDWKTLGAPFGHIAGSVQSVYLPASLTRIDGPEDNPCASPFAFTYGLKNLYLDAAQPPAVSSYVWHQAGNFTLHVPEGSKSSYENDTWPNGKSKWYYASPVDGGANVNITIVERPKVIFNTTGGSRPRYTYPVTDGSDNLYYWYVNAGTSAYSTNYPVDEAPVTEKQGAEFLGWFTAATGGEPYNTSTKVSLGKSTTLYARWAGATYTVTFDLQGGSYNGNTGNITREVANGTPPDLEEPQKENYVFAGWYADPNGETAWDMSMNNLVSDMTLYAKWAERTYSVKFIAEGATKDEITGVESGAVITAAQAPEMENKGDLVCSWYADAGCTVKWKFGTSAVISDTVLYAKWGVRTYTVSFDPQGGSSVAPIDELDYGSIISLPVAPVRKGFDFAGWYTNAGYTVKWNFIVSQVTADTTLYAKWTVQKYTVTFDVQGGSHVASIDGVEYGHTIAAPANPTKAGADFAGWYANSSYSTPWYFATSVVGSNMTLYAKWSTWKYTVTFDTRGGNTIAVQTVDYGNTVAMPETPVKAGFAFAGWYTGMDYETRWNFIASGISANLTLYAKWEAQKYTVAFDARGGGYIASITGVDYGNTIEAPKSPVRTGYDFIGWYTDLTFATVWNFPTSKVVGSMTLYAKWNDDWGLGIARIRQASQPGFYPNPADDRITVAGLDGTELFTLTDLAGKIIFSRRVSNGETVSIDETPRGVYMVRIGGKTLKLIKK